MRDGRWGSTARRGRTARSRERGRLESDSGWPVGGSHLPGGQRPLSQKPGQPRPAPLLSRPAAHTPVLQAAAFPFLPVWEALEHMPPPRSPWAGGRTLMPALRSSSSVGLTCACSRSSTPVTHSSCMSRSRLSTAAATFSARSCTLSRAWACRLCGQRRCSAHRAGFATPPGAGCRRGLPPGPPGLGPHPPGGTVTSTGQGCPAGAGLRVSGRHAPRSPGTAPP